MSRMYIDPTSQSDLSPTKQTPGVIFNSMDMPPPQGPSPRRPLLLLDVGNQNTNEKGIFRKPRVKPVSVASGIQLFHNLVQTTETQVKQPIDSPRSRITKLARRKSLISSSSVLQTISELSEQSGNATHQATPHDLGIPSQLISLLSQPIKCSSSDILTPNENVISNDNVITGKENLLRSGVRALSLDSPISPRKGDGFKRMKATQDFESPLSKRVKTVSHNDLSIIQHSLLRPSNLKLFKIEEKYSGAENERSTVVTKSDDELNNTKKFQRSQSESAVTIMQAMEQGEQDPLLIGDRSKRFILPLVEDGKLSDLKQINMDTLIELIDGFYDDVIDNYDIVDCRYPYEYNGGHIKGSLNLHTQKQIHEKYLDSKEAKPIGSYSKERNILIFHCEFSSQRGPEMCRFLRGADRSCNQESFPSLHYPELYILQGGYKTFFENHQEYCVPCLYTPMADPTHSEELRLYRSKSNNELLKSNSSSQLKNHRKMPCKKFVL